MATVYKASYVSLHVRKSNRAALGLYRDTLGFTQKDTEKGYCTHLSVPCTLAGCSPKLPPAHLRRGRGRRVCDAAVAQALRAVDARCVMYPYSARVALDIYYIMLHSLREPTRLTQHLGLYWRLFSGERVRCFICRGTGMLGRGALRWNHWLLPSFRRWHLLL